MQRRPANTNGEYNSFRRRSGKTHRLNLAKPLRGGIRL